MSDHCVIESDKFPARTANWTRQKPARRVSLLRTFQIARLPLDLIESLRDLFHVFLSLRVSLFAL